MQCSKFGSIYGSTFRIHITLINATNLYTVITYWRLQFIPIIMVPVRNNFSCVGIELGRGKNKVIALTFHPGVLDTDLSRPYHKSVPKDEILTPLESAGKLLVLMEQSTVKDSGRFIDVTGVDIPW